jgi:hypothetical protein
VIFGKSFRILGTMTAAERVAPSTTAKEALSSFLRVGEVG